jgi:hypothetical protein
MFFSKYFQQTNNVFYHFFFRGVFFGGEGECVTLLVVGVSGPTSTRTVLFFGAGGAVGRGGAGFLTGMRDPPPITPCFFIAQIFRMRMHIKIIAIKIKGPPKIHLLLSSFKALSTVFLTISRVASPTGFPPSPFLSVRLTGGGGCRVAAAQGPKHFFANLQKHLQRDVDTTFMVSICPICNFSGQFWVRMLTYLRPGGSCEKSENLWVYSGGDAFLFNKTNFVITCSVGEVAASCLVPKNFAFIHCVDRTDFDEGKMRK